MGRKIKYSEKLIISSFSIEPTLLEQLVQRAKEENRSKNEIIRKSIIYYLRGGMNDRQTKKV